MQIFQAVSSGLILCAGLPALAQDKTSAEVSAGVGSAQLFSVLLSLVFVVVLIFALAWLVRRVGMGGGFLSRSAVMKVVATLPLGTKERLVIVDVADKQLLLGVTAQSIQTLHVFDEAIASTEIQSGELFSEKLKAVMTGQKPKAVDNNDSQGKSSHE
ncbi:flagellar biosynthetic protein FliO [Gilvimarinus sp. 1_MG-2023]|uniref:flagellar biosynthetic protein FliO n=1 Tax=Gilvimarinus sp. 1_MG-2023 TaxID=3062638 RepID=UPI0026E2B298|nr:flagellar biosynthetic protein FliO [Gilvimarinus sp. 1_MG-2023]MDO6745954.1 flagellar biosynthetic protein FliO [Gilvimarinus sp. 1_MG-2023]